MLSKKLITILFFLGSLTTLLDACQPRDEIIDFKVDTVPPIRSTIEIEDRNLSNCNNNGELIETLGSLDTIGKKITVAEIAANSNRVNLDITEPVRLQLEIEVENAYKPVYEAAVSRLETIIIRVAPCKQETYTVQWDKLVYQAEVSFSKEGSVFDVPYVYELDVPKIIYEEGQDCADISNVCAELIQASITPELAVSLPATGMIAVLRRDDFLYKGPHMDYGLLDGKRRLKGEMFDVIARNTNNDWIFVQASDGNKGWLYISWVLNDFELDKIPPTSDYPPLPTPTVTPTKRGPYP